MPFFNEWGSEKGAGRRLHSHSPPNRALFSPIRKLFLPNHSKDAE